MQVAEKVVHTLVDLWFDDFIQLKLELDVISFRNLLLSLIKRQAPSSCSAGKGYFAVTPDLSVYTCQTALFEGDKPRWRLDQDNGMIEMNGGFPEGRRPERANNFCKECECGNGCFSYCRAQWEIQVPTELPDTCRFQRLARARIMERIYILYQRGETDIFYIHLVQLYKRKILL